MPLRRIIKRYPDDYYLLPYIARKLQKKVNIILAVLLIALSALLYFFMITEIPSLEELALFPVIFAGTLFTATTGFGSKLMSIAVIENFLDIKKAIAFTNAATIFLYLTTTIIYIKYFDKRIFIKMLPPIVVGLVVGLISFKFLDPLVLQIGFSIFLVVYVHYQLNKEKYSFKITPKKLKILSFIYGFLSSSLGAAGPFLAAILFEKGLRKHSFLSLSATILCLTSVISASGYASFGLFAIEDLLILALLAITMVIAALISKKIMKRLPGIVFDYIVLGLLLLLGIRGLLLYVF